MFQHSKSEVYIYDEDLLELFPEITECGQLLTQAKNLLGWEIDLENKFMLVGSTIKIILGYDPEDLIGEDLKNFLTNPSGEKLIKTISDDKKYKRVLWDEEYDFIHKDGKIIPLQTTGVPILNEFNQVIGFRGMSYRV